MYNIKIIALLASLIGLATLSYLFIKLDKSNNVPRSDIKQEELASSDMVVIDNPQPHQIVKSPLKVTGKARGGWFFEGDFPITLYYGVGDDFVTTYATAQGDWMTDEFVDFTATIEFPPLYAEEGILELTKNNPSDIRELDSFVRIPVKFR